jgi:HEAT repeat protein
VLASLSLAVDASAFVWPSVPERVARALESSDVAERRLAAQRLAELPAGTALKLIGKTLGDPDVEVRLRAAQAAVTLRMPRAGDLVISWLSEGDARLRLAACDVIRAAPTDRSVVALGRVLGDPDAHVRLAAASAMGGSALAEAVSPLLGHLDDPSVEVRAEVARALGRIGDARAVVPLIGKVQDSAPEVRRAVARALGALADRRAASALMLALQDASHDVRVEAVGALGQLRSDEATPAIAPLVDNEPGTTAVFAGGRSPSAATGSSEVRVAALRALGRIGSEGAVRVLVAALAKDDPATQRSPVRDALLVAGPAAAPMLVSTLGGSPHPRVAAGAALALAAIDAPGTVTRAAASESIVRGMQRGVVPLRFGLRALATLGEGAALPTVLELIDDDDATVRREAMRAAAALLDPTRPDGRAVDPANAALRDATTPLDEKVELVRLLGRTGAPRAQAVLLPLAGAKNTSLRIAVLEALGTLRVPSAAGDRVLLDALGAEQSDVRLSAATALGKVGSPAAGAALLDRLLVAAEQDRGALGIALAGVMSRSGDAALAKRVGAAVATSPDVARDALIEGLGRMRGAGAGAELDRLAGGAIDDRRKVAEALAGHVETRGPLQRLARDADPGVRANAAWSLGTVGRRDAVPMLIALLRDPDAAVAGNAAAALGRVVAREPDAAAAPALCSALADARPYVRANALQALARLRAPCDAHPPRELLARDPSEAVRLAAAAHLAGAAALKPGTPGGDADRRALARCAAEDKSSTVAARCSSDARATTAAGNDSLRAKRAAGALEDVTVFVVPDGKNAPIARAAFTLVRPDGYLRMGVADRRGAVFEFAVPDGSLRLGVPAALAR